MAAIVNMNIPRNCRLCHFSLKDDYTGIMVCSLKQDYVMDNGRSERRDPHCPLKSVEGLIDELEIYAGNQCDSWDNSVVNGAINIIKEYCGIGE